MSFRLAGGDLAAAEAVGYASVGVERDPDYLVRLPSAVPLLAALPVPSDP